MNLLQLVTKQMRQRALSTWLTLLSVVLGVALATAIMILRREGAALFGQNEYGYEVIVGSRGSPLQLTLNTVYHLDKSPGNIPFSFYEALLVSPQYRRDVKMAIPYAVGDSYKGQRIIGTLPRLFNVDDEGQPLPAEKRFEYRRDQGYEIAQGRVFHPRKFEAVIGSDITKLTGLKIGDTFQATHGMPSGNQKPDIHDEVWTVVGVLKPTHTANDHVLFIPLISFYTIFEHGEAEIAHQGLREGQDVAALGSKTPTPSETEEEKHYTLSPDGIINLTLPKDAMEVSAVLVKTRSSFAAQSLMYTINNQNTAMAVNPATTMREFFDVFLAPSSYVLQAISYLVTVVAAVSILVSIYNSVSARMREIAILRALGATRARILSLICLEAGLVGLIGAVIGLIAGHGLSGVGSLFFQRLMGQGIDWLSTDRQEWLYLLAVTLLAVLAGLVPALKAYRSPVATNLVAG